MKKLFGLLGSVWGGVITHKTTELPDNAGYCRWGRRGHHPDVCRKGSTQSIVSRFSSLGQIHLLLARVHTTTGRYQDSIWQRQYSHSGRCRSDCRKC